MGIPNDAGFGFEAERHAKAEVARANRGGTRTCGAYEPSARREFRTPRMVNVERIRLRRGLTRQGYIVAEILARHYEASASSAGLNGRPKSSAMGRYVTAPRWSSSPLRNPASARRASR